MESSFRVVFVLRGLPSTGKSKLAKLLTNVFESGVILSTDDFFYDEEKNYNFDKAKIGEAHKWNFNRFKNAIKENTSPIIIDNTNIKSHHFYHYIDYAQRHEYRVAVVTIPHNDVSDKELEERSTHGVERDLIRRMRKEFQWKIH